MLLEGQAARLLAISDPTARAKALHLTLPLDRARPGRLSLSSALHAVLISAAAGHGDPP